MEVIKRYFLYMQEISEGNRPLPEGMTLTQAEPFARAGELQGQIMEMGVPAFVSLCAAQDGQTLSQEDLAAFRQEDLMAALQAMLASPEGSADDTLRAECPTTLQDDTPSPANSEATGTEAPQEEDDSAPPQIDEPDGPRSAYEVLIDCCCLDEKLMYYLIDVLKRHSEEEFQKLALVTARKAFTIEDFLYWYAVKPSRGSREELVCVTLMDTCFDRLAKEGQVELIAALISGDQKTFELFRCDAPELVHFPVATFEWFEQYYLQGLYPLRYMLKFNGVKFPKTVLKEDLQ
ncbi:MAG: hypothetical protein IKM59_02255 [Oscillospiraceae bacterium]|nr:hypothetical protein [Oscillospiraceae bacterium]